MRIGALIGAVIGSAGTIATMEAVRGYEAVGSEIILVILTTYIGYAVGGKIGKRKNRRSGQRTS